MVSLSLKGKHALDELVERAGKDPKMPSFIFGVTTADDEVYFNGAGYRMFDEPTSGPIDADSVFWICSQTKLITHLAALHLIHNSPSLISLSSPVSSFIPEFTSPIILSDIMDAKPTYTSASEVITVQHLLNHTSGMFYPLREIMETGPERQMRQYSATQSQDDPVGGFLKLVKGDLPSIPLQFEPGTNWAYGFSSDILGFVIERASGMTLEKYMKDNIFDRLGMKTSFYLTPEFKAKQVGLTLCKEGKLQLFDPNIRLFETDPSKVTRHLGGVGLYSSARDYLTLLRHLLQIEAGTAPHPIVPRQVVIDLFTPSLSGPENGQTSMEEFFRFDPFSPNGPTLWQWGPACAINTTDWEGRRRKGSAFWFGWANTYHFVDPVTRIAAVFETQMIPAMDRHILEYVAEFERVVYDGLETLTA